ncbi:hypothetical protein REPUB_Repub06bG0057800 [Reevesia pubescens]
MVGFVFRHFLLRRSQIMSRHLRSMRIRLARKRRVNRRIRRSLSAMQIAASEIEEHNWRIREENELIFVANILSDQCVYDCLVEIENDPLMRRALERINALDGRNNTANLNQAQPAFRDGSAADDGRD